jgi:ABC-type taurine transport system substrate-binding protein/outer membrane protein OmpA-like peptidoglycan-associated protein
MNRFVRVMICTAVSIVVLMGVAGGAPRYVELHPFTKTVTVPVGDVTDKDEVIVPLITWGGDIATILANGGARATSSSSIFGTKGLKLKLRRMDEFKKQVEMFMSGEMPYLRGTAGMINMAAEVLSKDPRTKPVVIYQMTWSAGGDCLVVKQGIRTVKDLKGKTIALQAYGPHIDYLTTILKDAGLSKNDVALKWTKDLTGTDNTPGEALYERDVDAAFVIIPDGLMLTSNGTVGTGSEGSVKGARILMSTKTANRVIADVYAVRADYLEKHEKLVKNFVHGLLLAEQKLRELFNNKNSRLSEFKALMRSSAEILLDSPQAVGDVEALYADCEYVGFRGNVKFFGDPNWPRGFRALNESIQTSFVSMGLLSRKTLPLQAKWSYDSFRAGLTGIDDVQAPRFRSKEVARVVEKKRAMGTLGEGELFSFEIFFKPNQNTFPADMYADDFKKVVELASTYGGAVIIVEGHSDPMGYLRKKKAGAQELVLKRIKQAAKNLSLTRAVSVRDAVMSYAKENGVNLDRSQFTVVGHGILKPKTGMCGSDPCPPKTEEEWLGNMRVAFRIIQLEAEESVFRPLN